MSQDKTMELVRAYYASWKDGLAGYDEARVRAVLAPDLVFESPMIRRDGAVSFLSGLSGFVKTLKELQMLQLLSTGNEAAAVYDCALTGPTETLRCGEFFRIEGDRIKTIRLVFDATGYRKSALP